MRCKQWYGNREVSNTTVTSVFAAVMVKIWWYYRGDGKLWSLYGVDGVNSGNTVVAVDVSYHCLWSFNRWSIKPCTEQWTLCTVLHNSHRTSRIPTVLQLYSHASCLVIPHCRQTYTMSFYYYGRMMTWIAGMGIGTGIFLRRRGWNYEDGWDGGKIHGNTEGKKKFMWMWQYRNSLFYCVKSPVGCVTRTND